MRLSKHEASEYGKRGQKNRTQDRKHCIEGEYVVIEEIAARIGKCKSIAERRFKRERAKDGPVTWQGLNQQ